MGVGAPERENNARYLERGNHTIAFLYVLDGRANFVDHSHILVTEDVPALQLHYLLVVQVQITAADGGARYADDDVCGLSNGWDGSFLHTDIWLGGSARIVMKDLRILLRF